MRRRMLLLAGLCLILAGCSAKQAPKLLDPVGDTADSARVTRGEMYNISTYDSAVSSEFKEIKLPSDAVIKDARVQVGDTVTAGSPILTLDNERAGSQAMDVDAQIAELEADNTYLNQIDEYELQILEYELQLLKEGDGTVYQLNDKTKEISEKRSKLERAKVEQQREIAELQLSKSETLLENGEVLSPWDGTIVYLNAGSEGAVLDSGTVVAIVAKKDSKILFGDYIEKDVMDQMHRVYARIGDKEYNVTNVPYDQITMNQRIFFKLPLFSTFYIEEAPEVTLGMFASIVVVTDYVEDALQIPENALLSDEDGYYVYKLNGKEFERKNVSIGHMTDTAVEITKGLEEGDEVYVRP